MKESLSFMESIIDKVSDTIIVGCSGGPDSMCLLHLLNENHYHIVCAHVNHNIREESKEEYEFLECFCQEHNIIFEGMELENDKTHDEYYYRKKRYSFYKALAKKYNAKFVATAHHGDDLIETILMRINRGSTMKGYLGFPKIYDEYGIKFIKPLIFYTKDEIINYDEKHDVPYRIDESNTSNKYTRNRYRNKVLPFLKEENKDADKKFLQFSEELESANEFINRYTKDAMKENYDGTSIDLKQFLLLDEYIQRRELEVIFSDIYRDDIDSLTKKHMDLIIELLKTKKNSTIDLPKAITLKLEYDKLRIIREQSETESYDIELEDSVELPNGYIVKKIDESDDTSNNIIRLNSDSISLPLRIRNFKKGDKMTIKNMENEKKVTRIFIDSKVPSSLRKTYPILVDNDGNILWLPGLRKSKFDNEKTQKYDIILWYTKKGED